MIDDIIYYKGERVTPLTNTLDSVVSIEHKLIELLHYVAALKATLKELRTD